MTTSIQASKIIESLRQQPYDQPELLLVKTGFIDYTKILQLDSFNNEVILLAGDDLATNQSYFIRNLILNFTNQTSNPTIQYQNGSDIALMYELGLGTNSGVIISTLSAATIRGCVGGDFFNLVPVISVPSYAGDLIQQPCVLQLQNLTKFTNGNLSIKWTLYYSILNNINTN
jgi:hypothetical protein